MSEGIEHRMSIEDLRTEVRQLWNEQVALADALNSLPETLSDDALMALIHATSIGHHMNLWQAGKAEQNRLGLSVVGPNSETETAYGLWSVIRPALLAARPTTPPRSPQ